MDPSIALPDFDIHPKRKRELLVTRHLLKAIGFKAEIKYLDNGKPYIEDGRYVSISHCGDLAGFVVSDKPVGMDIQDDNPKLAAISSRFCHAEELLWAKHQLHTLTCFTILWACKEAVFKIYGENVVFADQIRVETFHADNQLPLSARCERHNEWHNIKVHRIYLTEYWILIAVPCN